MLIGCWLYAVMTLKYSTELSLSKFRPWAGETYRVSNHILVHIKDVDPFQQAKPTYFVAIMTSLHYNDLFPTVKGHKG